MLIAGETPAPRGTTRKNRSAEKLADPHQNRLAIPLDVPEARLTMREQLG